MTLNLNIPSLKDKPFITAETRPEIISASLERLQSNNALDFAAHLRGELTVLNRQKLSASTRIQALNIYRSNAINTANLLTHEFSNASLPLHDIAKLAANAAEGLWQELGFGYKLALIDLQNQLISLSRDKDTVFVITRAMHAVTEQALIYFQTYQSVPESIWVDLYQLYFCAVQMGVHHESTLDTVPSIWSQSQSNFTIDSAFKHAMLMYLANPQNLTQKEISLVSAYLAHHVHHAQITAIKPLQTTYGAFIIDLANNQAPEAYSKQKELPDPHTDILLQTIELVRNIHSHLNQIQNQTLPIDCGIPESANIEDYNHLLTHLIKHLGITPKRQFKRSKKIGELDLVTGIDAAHFLSSKDSHPHQTAVKASRWHLINMSATGMCIRRHAQAEKNIKIGHLISIRLQGEHNWALGVVRWAHCGNRGALVIGIQLIAPFTQSAIASGKNDTLLEKTLVLPQAATQKSQSLIVARGTFSPGLRLNIQWGKEIHPIIFTRLIERTQQYDRIQYKMVA